MIIRPIQSSDFEEISDIGINNYPDEYYESTESFISKAKGYLSGCFVCLLEEKICGYIISFPYFLNEYYPINFKYENFHNPNCYYIHDLCVLPEYRNKGVAKKLLDKASLHDYKKTALIAVCDSSSFWTKMNFTHNRTINYYGLPADYMIKTREGGLPCQ